MMRCLNVIAVISLFASLACGKPMLWIGEAQGENVEARDAGTDAAMPATPADSGAGASAEPEAGASPDASSGIDTAEPPRGDADPPDAGGVVDASEPKDPEPVPEDDEEDAGMPAEPERPTKFPTRAARCPELTGPGMYTFGEPRSRTLSVRIFIAPDAKTKPAPGGPLILYWHAFGSNSSEVLEGLGQAAIDDVVARGGVVASFVSKFCASCGLPDDAAWYVEDDVVSDHVVACALEQARIDTRHIHTLGLSAGGLRSVHLALARNDFIASIVSYSGGYIDTEPLPAMGPANKVAAIIAWGGPRDVIGIDFAAAARRWYETFEPRGHYVMMCNHGNGHTMPLDLAANVYQFFLEHPYRVQPEPYANGVPSQYPDYCSNELQR